MYFLIHSRQQNLPDIMTIISQAQVQLKNAGVDLWQHGYPDEAQILEDIASGTSFLPKNSLGETIATVMLSFEADPNYSVIEGKWLTDTPYAVVHRLAVREESKGTGLAGWILKQVEAMCRTAKINSIRIDTHEKNLPMQKNAVKMGFTSCGIVYVKDGAKRIAFEKIL